MITLTASIRIPGLDLVFYLVFEDFERRMKDQLPPRSGGAYMRKLTQSALGEERALSASSPRPPRR